MKKIGFIFLFLCVSVLGAQAKEHFFDIGYEIAGYKYEEPGLMNLKAKIKQGVSAGYTYVGTDTGYLVGLEFKYLQGDVDYHGGTWGGDPLTAKNLKDYYFEAAFKTGRQYSLNDKLSVAGYTGLGWRQLRNHLEQSGEGGYLRQSTYLYLPLGAYLTYELPDAWRVRVLGELDLLLRGRQISDFDTGEITNDQTNGWGTRVSLKAEKIFGNVGVFIEPFWRYWSIEESDVVSVHIKGKGVTGVVEPKNKTHEYGIKIGVSF